MLLTVAFVPPVPVLEELNAVVVAAGWRPGDLETIASTDMQLSVAAFGNVTRGDTVDVATVLSGTVTGTTGVDLLERLLAGLEAHQGEPWEATHLSLLRTAFDVSRAGAQTFEVLREFALPAP